MAKFVGLLMPILVTLLGNWKNKEGNFRKENLQLKGTEKVKFGLIL